MFAHFLKGHFMSSQNVRRKKIAPAHSCNNDLMVSTRKRQQGLFKAFDEASQSGTNLTVKDVWTCPVLSHIIGCTTGAQIVLDVNKCTYQDPVLASVANTTVMYLATDHETVWNLFPKAITL